MSRTARSELMTVATARWLVTDGLPLVDELAAAAVRPADVLAVVMRLRSRGLDQPQAAAVVGAAEARRRLGDDLRAAGWGEQPPVLFSTAAAEQASHPLVARHRALRFAGGDEVFDLGCGAGVDAISLARRGADVTGVDLDPARLILAEHNARVLGVAITTLEDDACSVDVPRMARWHADPSRRRKGRRARTLAQTQPATAPLLAAMADQPGGALVVSPGVSWQDPDLPTTELEFVQVRGRLVEAVAWIGDLAQSGVAATATHLSERDGQIVTEQLFRRGSAPDVPVGPVGDWLLDPAPAAARARVHHALIAELGGTRIANTRALCTATDDPDSVWWTAWQVEAVLPGRARSVRRWLDGRDEEPLSIELHGTDQSLSQWWHELGNAAQGPVGRRVHVVDLPDGVRAIVTRHASLSHPRLDR